MIDGKTIADNIRAERNRTGLTIEEVSKELGVSRQTYSEYEKDASSAKASTLINLARILKCNISDFFILK